MRASSANATMWQCGKPPAAICFSEEAKQDVFLNYLTFIDAESISTSTVEKTLSYQDRNRTVQSVHM